MHARCPYTPAVRLQAGVGLPEFSVTDLAGEAITPASYSGKRLWLILSRFAACPFCSLRLHGIIERWHDINAAGVDVLVIFPSKEKRVAQFARKYEPPFRVAADPEQKVFELFGSETSWAGELKTAINIPKVFKALAKAKMSPLGVDDVVHRMPSDYLIEPDGTIGEVHHGEELDDGFAVETVLNWAGVNTD